MIALVYYPILFMGLKWAIGSVENPSAFSDYFGLDHMPFGGEGARSHEKRPSVLLGCFGVNPPYFLRQWGEES
jgi:hypothetical protein